MQLPTRWCSVCPACQATWQRCGCNPHPASVCATWSPWSPRRRWTARSARRCSRRSGPRRGRCCSKQRRRRRRQQPQCQPLRRPPLAARGCCSAAAPRCCLRAVGDWLGPRQVGGVASFTNGVTILCSRVHVHEVRYQGRGQVAVPVARACSKAPGCPDLCIHIQMQMQQGMCTNMHMAGRQLVLRFVARTCKAHGVCVPFDGPHQQKDL